MTKKIWNKLKQFEYWPMNVFLAPVYVYGAYCAVRNGHPWFFSASNPGMKFGGLNQPKSEILQHFSADLVAKSVSVQATENWNDIKKMVEKNLTYPIIAKPEIGLRGQGINTLGVEKIHSDTELKKYVTNTSGQILLEEFLNYELEFGVFYIKKPWEKTGKISSLMQREFLQVVGDGNLSLEQLIKKHPRAKNYETDLAVRYKKDWQTIVKKNEKFSLGTIGNHCRGTKFCDRNHKITPKMEKTFERISQQFPGFYYGRYDIKANSWEDLENGNLKIIELNGFFAEPGHVYDPNMSLWKAYKDYIWHIRQLSKISRYNHKKNNIPYTKFAEGKKILKKYT